MLQCGNLQIRYFFYVWWVNKSDASSSKTIIWHFGHWWSLQVFITFLRCHDIFKWAFTDNAAVIHQWRNPTHQKTQLPNHQSRAHRLNISHIFLPWRRTIRTGSRPPVLLNEHFLNDCSTHSNWHTFNFQQSISGELNMCFKETWRRLRDGIDGSGSEWMIIRMSERGPLSLPKPHPQHFLGLISLGG